MKVYKLIFTKSARKDIEKLDSVTKKRLLNKFKTFAQNPLEYAKKLVNHRIGTYRWRVGNYRVIFDLDDVENIAIVLRVRHRKNVYT
ncbi:MAG: type II toxin-antitoxin system RelE/ParE family toxin [Candidatus Pacebacteria bacterium CG10_big_fil_rev_8_21_14_0_10_45_6]|nr:MAG: type II toxin-antitoxin system RelE/ParE family toxin [Candidatus Pacebacteria bacterium CG10_big_fil_rev_8_21_14_0_10_45_6]